MIGGEGAMDAALLLARIWLAVVFLVHGVPKLISPSRIEHTTATALFGEEYGKRWSGGRAAAATQFAALGVPFPTFSGLAAGATQVLGSALVLVGWGARAGAVLLVVNMAGAVAVRWRNGLVGAHGFEYPMALLVLATVIAIGGAGQYRIG